MKKSFKRIACTVLGAFLVLGFVPVTGGVVEAKTSYVTKEETFTIPNISLHEDGTITWDSVKGASICSAIYKDDEKVYSFGSGKNKINVMNALKEIGANAGMYTIMIQGIKEEIINSGGDEVHNTYYSKEYKYYYSYENPNPKLEAPQNITADASRVSWNSVPRAEKYKISLNGKSFTVSSNYADVYDFLAEGTKDYNVEIIAMAGECPKSNPATATLTLTKISAPVKITFDHNDSSGTKVNASTDNRGKIGALPNAASDGYRFAGWFTEKTGGTKITVNTSFTKDTTVYAHWIKNKYNITINGGAADKPAAGVGDTVNISAENGESNAVFDKWEIVSGNADIKNPSQSSTTFIMGSKDVTIKAVYKLNNGTINQVYIYAPEPVAGETPKDAYCNVDLYSIDSFSWIDVSTDEELSESAIFEEGKSYKLKAKMDYVYSYRVQSFPDVYVNDSTEGVTATISGGSIEKTFVAKPGICKVRFDANGGSGTMSEDAVEKNGTILLPENEFTAPNGLEFDRWSVGNPGDEYTVNSNVIIKAVWKEKNPLSSLFTVKFETNGGTAVSDQIVERECKISTPEETTREGYIFEDWYEDSSLTKKFDVNKRITADTTVYAKWDKLGKIPSGEFIKTDKGIQYYKEDGSLAKAEWFKVAGKWYYACADGYLASEEWIEGWWINADGSCTYDGQLSWKQNATGWWVEDTAGWYPVKEWQKIDGIWYYFNDAGYMASGEYYNGYWFNKDGSWDPQYKLTWKSNATGWWVEDISGWWPSSYWLKIDGNWYYFDADGYMVTNQYVDGYWIGEDGICQ